MKLTEKQKAKVMSVWGEWEEVHSIRDDFMRERLEAIDPEFVKDMDRVFDGAEFWYA